MDIYSKFQAIWQLATKQERKEFSDAWHAQDDAGLKRWCDKMDRKIAKKKIMCPAVGRG